MTARALSVLLVSNDRKMLRHSSKLLSVFGYAVSGVTNLGQARQRIAAEFPDIVVFDGSAGLDAVLALCGELSRGKPERYLFKALLLRDAVPDNVARALEAGVDEILGYPIEHGELLSRLRTAARVLEYERRIGERFGSQSQDDRMGPTRFLRDLTSEIERGRAKGETATCVAIEIDSYEKSQLLYGTEASASLAAKVFEIVTECSQGKLVVRLENHRFAVAFLARIEQAVAWAEDLRKRVASLKTAEDEDRVTPTVSCGVVVRKGEAATAEDLVSAACSILPKVQQSGGDYVAREDEFTEEEHCWAELARTGALFDRTLARDIMVPCTATLKPQDTIAAAAETFDRTRLRALIVVDDEGKLAGLVTSHSVQVRMADENCGDKAIGSVMTREVVSFDEQTTLVALMDYFAQESPLVIVIVNKGRPTGMVTPSSLATLSEQLTTESFAVTSAARGRADLIVPNLCGVDGD